VSLVAGQGDRLIDVEWDLEPGGVFIASIEVKALDRTRLLATSRRRSPTTRQHPGLHTQTGTDRVSKMRFDMELGDPSHLDSLLSTIRGIDSVYDAYRVVPGKRARSVTSPAVARRSTIRVGLRRSSRLTVSTPSR
jgi:GTP pyrophosphokinase